MSIKPKKLFISVWNWHKNHPQTIIHIFFLTLPLYSIVLVLFVFLVLYHGRQVEIDSSLDFLWKQQARKELGWIHLSSLTDLNSDFVKYERFTLSLLYKRQAIGDQFCD